MFNLGKFWFQKRNPREILTLWSTLLVELSFLKMACLVSVNNAPVPLVLKIAKTCELSDNVSRQGDVGIKTPDNLKHI